MYRARAALAALVAVALWSPAAFAVQVDVSTTYQTIDGFGFFGPKDVWWGSGSASHFYDDAWLDLVIDDLGMTIWRNEYYSEEGNQDANWAKQSPMVSALKAKADESNVPLKFIYSVWSPPSALKCDGTNGCWGDPTTTPHADGLKNGGTLCEANQTDLANWLIEGIQKHEAIGVDLYAISFQNEPLFCQFYNSCFYSYGYYRDVLKAIGPVVKAAYPAVKFFGAEHMLAANMHDGNSQFQWIYESQIMRDPDALQNMDIWAYHGYSDGVNPIPGSEMAQLWSLVRDSLARVPVRPIWMTETSGYDDSWGPGGALELAAAMFAALRFGNLAGWVHWYGAGNWIDGGASLNKRGCVAKQYARFLRPGAVRVDVAETGVSGVHAVAFTHAALDNMVIIAMNSGTSEATVSFEGSGVPAEFALHRTSAGENCASIGTVNASGVTLAPQSLSTLVSGSVYEGPTASVSRSARTPAGRTAALQGHRIYAIDGRLLPGVAQPTARGVYLRAPARARSAGTMCTVVQPQ